MSETLTIGLTKQQRDTLLRGLRYVRSSLMLDIRDPDPALDAQRENELREVAQLVDQLNEAPALDPAARVNG